MMMSPKLSHDLKIQHKTILWQQGINILWWNNPVLHFIVVVGSTFYACNVSETGPDQLKHPQIRTRPQVDWAEDTRQQCCMSAYLDTNRNLI